MLGEVVAVHIATRLLRDGVYDTAAAGHPAGGGAADYFSIGPEQLFRMYRPAESAFSSSNPHPEVMGVETGRTPPPQRCGGRPTGQRRSRCSVCGLQET